MTLKLRDLSLGNKPDVMYYHWKYERDDDVAIANIELHSFTLGQLIDYLNRYSGDTIWDLGFCNAHSYRGIYAELAFEPKYKVRVDEMLEVAHSCLGETFEGYKGGDFKMDQNTEVWLAYEGSSGGTPLSELTLKGMRHYFD